MYDPLGVDIFAPLDHLPHVVPHLGLGQRAPPFEQLVQRLEGIRA